MEWVPVLRWLVVLGVLAGLGAPIAAAVLPRFPARGAAFALPAALLPVTVLTFWIGQGTYGRHTVALAVGLTAGGSALAYWRGYRPNWWDVGRGLAVFLAAFAVLLAFRATSPTVTQYGGEHFLHFGMVNALARAPALPPEDIWFAGEPMRYYYGSQLQVSALGLLSGTPPRYAFTLGPPTFYGVLVVSAYGVGAAVVRAVGHSARLGGVLAAFFVAVGGATTTAIRLALGALPETVGQALAPPAVAGLVADRGSTVAEALASQGHPGEWSWFLTRYVVPGTIQEFPLYSFVKGDLHGHTLSTGYVVVAAALAFAYYRTPADQRWRRRGLIVGGLGLVAGVFGAMNTWSLPTAVGLATLAVAAADAHPATLLPRGVDERVRSPGPIPGESQVAGTVGRTRLAAEGWRLVLGAIAGVVVGVVGVVLASPFLVFGKVPTNEGIGFLPPAIQVGPFLVMYGGLLVLFVGFLGWRTWTAAGLDRTGQGRGLALGVVALVGTSLAAALLVTPVAGLLVPIVVAGWWLVRTDRAGFAAVLLVAGVGLLLSMELVFAKVYHWESAGARWETSLKVAVQAWTVMGLAAGTAAALLIGDVRRRLADARDESDGNPMDRVRAVLPHAGVLVLVGLVVVASLPFGALAVSTEVVDPLSDPDADATIDAHDDHDQYRPAEMAAIDWLGNRSGTPTIVEAAVAEREWPGRVSVFTGLPTVVGWHRHEEKFRGAAAIETRIADVEAIYDGSWSEAAAALRRHDVAYVYVGPEEWDRYGGEIVSRFYDRPGVSTAFENPEVTIYRIDQDELGG